ncbi:DUF5641 domain-containing protein [Trichonephila clavipes]|nr:DUF5641 domain-containing protein [Trichonephila clavipes]
MIGLRDRILRGSSFMSRHAKNIMKEAGMEMRKWISNDTVLMAQWAAEGFDTHPMDASIRLGTNKTKVLGMAWQTLDDCLTLDTKDNLRIPRLVLDSTNDEVSDLIEIHIFCDASKLAYSAAAYVKGLSVDTLISNNKWWTGPAFLRTDELPKTVSECPELNEVDYLPELKSKDSKEHTVLTLNFNQTFFDHLLSRSNKFLTIVRVLSFLYRFLFNIRNPTNKKTGPLTSDEMKEAEIYLMKQVQLSSFYKEIRAMQNGDDICNKSKILNLSPFLDDKGIIRVGGRLKHSRLPYSSKHPILLPAKNDLEVLTPAHFLIGRPITAIVEPSLLQCESNRLNVWQRITKSVQTIWKRWSLSYLNSLQQRKKWIVNKENLKLGDMVLIREENLPPCKWLLGRVVKIYMGKDKKVRVVDIKTGKGIYKRSINRLSILPIEN